MLKNKSDINPLKGFANEKLRYEFNRLENISDKWMFFRQLYMENIADILVASKDNIRRWANIYYLDWIPFFSPIERITWNSIRDLGHVVLYPQFPLFNYFIDFANPYLRIGIELDGKEYHDIEKDLKRDRFLNEYEWKIFRIKGSEANISYRNILEIEEENITGNQKISEIENWILNSADGVINAIRYKYFLTVDERRSWYSFYLDHNDPYIDPNRDLIDIETLMNQTLIKHRSGDFKL